MNSASTFIWTKEGGKVNLNDYVDTLGFDDLGILHVGMMTTQEAMDAKIQWAVSFGPNAPPPDEVFVYSLSVDDRRRLPHISG